MLIFLKESKPKNEKDYLMTQTLKKIQIKCYRDRCYAFCLLTESALSLDLLQVGRGGGEKKNKL